MMENLQSALFNMRIRSFFDNNTISIQENHHPEEYSNIRDETIPQAVDFSIGFSEFKHKFRELFSTLATLQFCWTAELT